MISLTFLKTYYKINDKVNQQMIIWLSICLHRTRSLELTVCFLPLDMFI